MKFRLSLISMYSLPLLICTLPMIGFSQKGKSLRFTSAFAPFPDTARANGHLYQGKVYPFKDHYDDSSVYLYVPTKFKPGKQMEIVVWFHGWGNNIDSAIQFYKLVEQFEASGRNAIFVFPEGPKNAPDSYGGKLERPGYFDGLIKDVLVQLYSHKILPSKKMLTLENCSISLAGHSGAYRVISKIIQYSKIDEVILFDALYGGNEAYLNWISSNMEHRFIAIYTKNGGTLENTRLVMNQLRDSLNVQLVHVKEAEVNSDLLKSNHKIFIESEQAHNDVITYKNNFQFYLSRKLPVN
jgi:hypothetical protein